MAATISSVRDNVLAFDQNRIDLTWERLQEQAVRAFRRRDMTTARTCWSRAFEIAERHFDRGDPRLAASQTNQAFSLIRQAQIHQAGKLFQKALLSWEDSWRWVPLMVPPRQPDETEAGQYGEAAQKDFYTVIERGRLITKAIEREHCPPEGDLTQWQKIKPCAMTDVRKLMASVFLIVSSEA